MTAQQLLRSMWLRQLRRADDYVPTAAEYLLVVTSRQLKYFEGLARANSAWQPFPVSGSYTSYVFNGRVIDWNYYDKPSVYVPGYGWRRNRDNYGWIRIHAKARPQI